MKRNRILALLIAGCMVLGNSNVLLYAEEADEQLFTIEEDDESEIQEDVMEEQADEEDDLIEDDEEVLFAAETADTIFCVQFFLSLAYLFCFIKTSCFCLRYP